MMASQRFDDQRITMAFLLLFFSFCHSQSFTIIFTICFLFILLLEKLQRRTITFGFFPKSSTTHDLQDLFDYKNPLHGTRSLTDLNKNTSTLKSSFPPPPLY